MFDLDRLDMEYYLNRENIHYKESYGASGAQFQIKTCPFCGKSQWKVYMNKETGLGNCFSGSCQAKFNKFTFIKAHLENISNSAVMQHIEAVLKEMGIFIPKRKKKVFEVKPDGFELPNSFKLPLPDGRNLEYLLKRGVDNNYTEIFDLRYCEKGYFVFKTETGQMELQDFSNRIIIPVYDINGTLKTFQGRTTVNAEKRYKFPQGLPGTGKFLYNANNCLGLEKIIMTEGPFDVIATQIAIDKGRLDNTGVIGSFGKHFSIRDGDDQLTRLMKLKQEGMKELIIMWDGELAAYKDAVKTAKELSTHINNIKIATLPKDKDPAEIHYSELEKVIKNAESFNFVKMSLNNPYK